MPKIKIKLNGTEFEAKAGETILEIANRNKIHIPSFCEHPDFPHKANCRVCSVEIKGWNKLATSCSTKAIEGMEIYTETEKVTRARNINIEHLFAEHIEKCATCIWRFECKLLDYASRYKILITTFNDRKGKRQTYKFKNAVEIDGSQCIDCRNCIDACSQLQKINFLELKGKGTDQEIVPSDDKKKHCILCGQCALHCPVSAAQEQAHYSDVERLIKKNSLLDINDKNKKIIVAQIAPSIRVSIGEDFNVPYGKNLEGEVVSGLKQLGFDYVFDVNFGADITTIVEAKELLSRITEKQTLPMFTSCCPGWVNYVEMYRPDLIPNLTTSRSPHIHAGGIIKTFWADKMKIDPKKIVVVSIMPCTAKKYDTERKEFEINKLKPVDISLTTRELTYLFKKNKVDLAKIKKAKPDNPLGEHSGASAIFGGSGGVMEAALRSAQYYACVANSMSLKSCNSKIEFTEVRGLDGIKESFFNIAGAKIKVAVVNGIGNIDKILDKLDQYDYIEVMACPGGCIGGGGQPIPTTPEIRKKRIEALYKIDKKKTMRKSYENKGVLEILEWLEKSGDLKHKILHTKYFKR